MVNLCNQHVHHWHIIFKLCTLIIVDTHVNTKRAKRTQHSLGSDTASLNVLLVVINSIYDLVSFQSEASFYHEYVRMNRVWDYYSQWLQKAFLKFGATYVPMVTIHWPIKEAR